jgi:bidirectional [NiFe] hydrogenase diaphorase subunit
MTPIHISIDGKEIECNEGETLLWAALDNGIYIPNLCAMREMAQPYGACRLCYVEVEGKDWPVTACTAKVKEGMVVQDCQTLKDQIEYKKV